ncbi:MAG TPA: biotin/lipoyl-containing protein [Nocardioides sp.]
MPAHVEAPFQGFVPPLVRVGDRVDIGDPVAMIEAMKMEAAITAPRSGTIVRVAVDGTESVAGGDLVVVLEPAARG